MTRRLTRSALRLLSLILTFLVAIGGFTVVKNLDWLSPLGIDAESHNSQVIHAIERTQEVSLLSLGIQGIKEQDQSGTIFGKNIPFSEKTVFLQYNFNAKLGINGAQVKVTETGNNSYLISVPESIFIGYDDPTFKIATEGGGVLNWVTPDIDKVQMVSEILDEDARHAYIASNEALLEEQAKVFYQSLISSIDPAAVTKFEFRS